MRSLLLPACILTALSGLPAQTVGSFVTSGIGCPGLVTDIGAADDTVSVGFDLGFTFPYPGGLGATTRIDISSNGYIYLESGTIATSRCCNGASNGVPIANFLSATPSFALFGQDLNASTTSPSGSGAIWYETDNNSVATISWDMVGEFSNPGASNTCQIQLYSDGRVVMCWTAVAALTHEALVGFSPGGGASDPGPVDFSSAMMNPIIGTSGAAIYETFASGTVDLSGLCIEWIPDGMGSYLVVQNGATLPCCIPVDPFEISSDTNPTIGQTMMFQVDGVPAGTSSSALLIGRSSYTPGIDLSVIGADGCTLYSSLDIGGLPFVASGSSAGVGLPISSDPGAVGVTFAMQAVAIAPGVNNFGVAFSNLGDMTVGDVSPIRITATGSNSFNNDTTSGFFKVANGNPLDIVAVTFDWATSSNPTQATMVFDTNQISMADRFDGGNSTLSGCLGTYRNGTETTTGLVFVGTPAATCDPAANTGWTTTGTIGAANTDVSFTFTSFNTGDVFELDIDTDGGAGVNGGSMAGMVVTVTLLGGTTRTGELQFIDTNTSRLDL